MKLYTQEFNSYRKIIWEKRKTLPEKITRLKGKIKFNEEY